MNISLENIKKPVVEEMERFQPFFKSSMKTKIPLLNIIIQYLLKRKGKQMRPLFVFLSAKLFGEINHSTFIAASLIELLHTATLIHDDVVDDSMQRRGFFSINALWKSKVAVLLGDFLLAKGLLLAIDNKEYELLNIVSEAVKEMSEGELLQIQKSRKLNITEEEYFEIIKKKTAKLIGSCTACGARSAGVNGELIEKMKLFGENAGIAFQIKDDLFDYEKSGITGKPAGNDLKEKKLTLPLIYSLENAKKTEAKRIRLAIKNHNHKKKTHQYIIDFVKSNGGIDYATSKMNEYKTNALNIINEFPDNEPKKAIENLVIYTTIRKK